MNTNNFRLRGLNQQIQLGKKGSKIKHNTNVVEVTDNDNVLIPLRAGTPLSSDHLVTRDYLENYVSTSGAYHVTSSITTDPSTLPAGTLNEIRIVTTEVSTITNVGELYKCVGSNTGDWSKVVVSGGSLMVPTVTLTGTGATYTGDHLYIWDDENSEWDDIGPSASSTNISKTEIATLSWNSSSGEINIGNAIPVNGRIYRIEIAVGTMFDGSTEALLQIGYTASPSAFVDSTDVDLTTGDVYVVDLFHKVTGSPLQISMNFTPGSGATQGTADIIVFWSKNS